MTRPAAPLRGFLSRLTLPTLLRATGTLLVAYVMFQYSFMWGSQQRLQRDWTTQGAQSTASTRLVIPRIGLDAIVVEGTSPKALRIGPGHMEDTALAGQPGNAIFAGHRDTFFRRLQELHTGDIITLRRAGRDFHYRVVSKSVVDPTDAEVLANTTEARLTLITCYPMHYIGPAPKRLIVKAELVS